MFSLSQSTFPASLPDYNRSNVSSHLSFLLDMAAHKAHAAFALGVSELVELTNGQPAKNTVMQLVKAVSSQGSVEMLQVLLEHDPFVLAFETHGMLSLLIHSTPDDYTTANMVAMCHSIMAKHRLARTVGFQMLLPRSVAGRQFGDGDGGGGAAYDETSRKRMSTTVAAAMMSSVGPLMEALAQSKYNTMIVLVMLMRKEGTLPPYQELQEIRYRLGEQRWSEIDERCQRYYSYLLACQDRMHPTAFSGSRSVSELEHPAATFPPANKVRTDTSATVGAAASATSASTTTTTNITNTNDAQ